MLNRLSEIKDAQNRIAYERAELREKSHDLKAEKRELTSEFIGAAFDKFLQDMNNSYYFYRYINGGYSSVFTQHVNRAFSWFSKRGFNDDHTAAIMQYNEALKNLKKVFVEEIKKDPVEAKRRLMNYANLKNIKGIS